jgi:hypothetical protein
MGVQQRRTTVDIYRQSRPVHGQPAVGILCRRLLELEHCVHREPGHRSGVPAVHDVPELALLQAARALPVDAGTISGRYVTATTTHMANDGMLTIMFVGLYKA